MKTQANKNSGEYNTKQTNQFNKYNLVYRKTDLLD